MSWLQDNPVGRVLVYACGGLLLLAFIMAVVWSLSVSVDTANLEADESENLEMVQPAREIDSLNELQVINQKPLFNENRLPKIAEIDDSEEEEDVTIEVKDAPDVKLTGVIITPDMKIATLTPSSGEENVMAHEGESLVGEYVGWKVGQVNPRAVVLQSNDGQQLKLDLQVHDTAIKEPPKPVAAAKPATAAQRPAGEEAQPTGEDGQPLSRAEQIRQRIAERREELRLEQEARSAQPQQAEQANAGGGAAPSKRSAYQNAMRNLMNTRKPKDNDGNDDKDG